MSDAPRQHSALDTRDNMLAIADTWPDLLDRLGNEGRAGGEKVRGTKTPGLAINEAVSDVLAELTRWVGFLVHVLIDETDTWNPPRGADAPALLTHIARERLGHFTAHEDEGLRHAIADDAHRLRRLAEHTAYPTGRRWVPVHVACLEYATTDLGERTPCTGEYRVMLDPEAHGMVPDMVCELDPTHRISPLDWQRAARKSGHDPAQIRERLAAVRGA